MFSSTCPTLSLFEHVYDALPPLSPEIIQTEMRHALDHVRYDPELTTEELEDTMIVFGKQLWPYMKAFHEFLDVYDGKLGEKFLIGKMPPAMKKRYKEFKEYGGAYRDLHSGHPAPFFSGEERQALCVALVESSHDVRAHAAQAVLSTERRPYEERIVEFQLILDDIEKRLDTLRQMADDEQEHPELAAEIRAHIREFEYGLCFLGSAPKYEAVCNAEEHFAGRKLEKRHFAHG
ncbi:MAG: hypothetical protein AAB932_00325 [Patescibacteria group bacterium]